MDVDFRTQAIHAGYEPLDNGRAAVPPIYASAAFDLGDAARGDALAGGDIDGTKRSSTAPSVWPLSIVDPAPYARKSGRSEYSRAGDNLIRLSAAVSRLSQTSLRPWPQHTDWMPHIFYKKPVCTHSEQLYTYAYDVYRFVLNADTMEITSRGRGRFRRG